MAFRSNIPNLIRALNQDIRAAETDAGDRVEEIIKEAAPVDTGALRDSVESEITDDGFRVVVGNDEVNYAIYVHDGTSRQEADPFVARNLGQIGSDVFAAYRRNIDFR